MYTSEGGVQQRASAAKPPPNSTVTTAWQPVAVLRAPAMAERHRHQPTHDDSGAERGLGRRQASVSSCVSTESLDVFTFDAARAARTQPPFLMSPIREGAAGGGQALGASPGRPVSRPRELSLGDADITSSGETDWKSFVHWATCVCVVHFDLELGQSMESVFPQQHGLDEDELKQICYLAFPDSNSRCMGDHQYNIRVPCSTREERLAHRIQAADPADDPGDMTTAAAVAARRGGADSPSKLSPTCRARQQDERAAARMCANDDKRQRRRFLFGSVYFRQIPDATNRRGYFQKSVVVLSRMAHFDLYSKMVSTIAPKYFDNEQSLEAACIDIGHWPKPVKGKAYTLPLLETTLEVRLPSSELDAQLARVPSQSPLTQAMAGSPSPQVETELHALFQESISKIHVLWELMLICEPLVVFAPDPVRSSEAVTGLLSLVAPLNHFGDYRPYFTIHDNDSQAFARKEIKPPQAVIGVTNPVFHKSLEHWPHRLHVAGAHLRRSAGSPTAKSPPSSSPFRKPRVAFATSYKASVEPDKHFVRAAKAHFAKPSRALPEELHDYAIRKNFMELTHTFLIPIERYVARLMPLQKAISPFKAVPRLGAFNAREFLHSLSDSLGNLNRVRSGNWVALYGKFLKSPNFRGWWSLRRRESNRRLLTLYLEAVLGANLDKWAARRTEIEVVDLLVRVKDAVKSALKSTLLDRTKLTQLRAKTDLLICALPGDLQASLRHPDLPQDPEPEPRADTS